MAKLAAMRMAESHPEAKGEVCRGFFRIRKRCVWLSEFRGAQLEKTECGTYDGGGGWSEGSEQCFFRRDCIWKF